MIAAPTTRTIYIPKKRNVLDLFTVEGEGGYRENQYTFMFKSSCFFNDNILASVKGVMSSPNTKIQKYVIAGQTFNYASNILRIVLGNNNKCIMYRDGSVDIGGVNSKFPEFGDIISQIRDTFCPSSYSTGGTQYQQMFLLENGDLVLVNTYTKKTPVVLLSNVDKFVTKNQAHRSDAIVALKNGDMYHVWCGPTPTESHDGNGTASGVIKIPNIKYSDIKFCAIGDPPACAVVCFKNEPNKLYRFEKGYGTNFKITGIKSTPIPSMTLENDEYYIHGMSHEFNSLFITNKKIMGRGTGGSYTSDEWSISWDRLNYPTSPTPSNPVIQPKQIVTPTAYSMIIEDNEGKYWFCGKGSSYMLQQPISYEFFDSLKTFLDPIRKSY